MAADHAPDICQTPSCLRGRHRAQASVHMADVIVLRPGVIRPLPASDPSYNFACLSSGRKPPPSALYVASKAVAV